MGAAAAFVGLPLWQTPTMDNAVGFFADLAEAVPDLPGDGLRQPVLLQVRLPASSSGRGSSAKAPTVIATKVGFPLTQEHLDAARHQVNFMTGEGTLGMHYRMAPESVTAAWATSAAMGPEPWVAFLDAHAKGDTAAAEAALADIEGVPLPIPDFADFDKYNIQLEKARIEAAGYTRCGPPRAPYRDLPADWAEAAETTARRGPRCAPSTSTQADARPPDQALSRRHRRCEMPEEAHEKIVAEMAKDIDREKLVDARVRPGRSTRCTPTTWRPWRSPTSAASSGIVFWNLEPGQENDYHMHPTTEHLHVVVAGEVEYTLGDLDPITVKAGQAVMVPEHVPHGIRNKGTGAGVVLRGHEPRRLREGARRPAGVMAADRHARPRRDP